MWWEPTAISAGCLIVGAFAAARWLPDLAPGVVGGLAFFLVCGLIAGSVAMFGLRCYDIVRELKTTNRLLGLDSGDLLAGELMVIIRDCGALLALAAIVYLLAPRTAGGPSGPAAIREQQ